MTAESRVARADRSPHRGRGRFASRVCMLAGGALLLAAGSSYARGALARDAARARWAELEAERTASGARAFAGGRTSFEVGEGMPVARLVIPRLELDEVVVEGVGERALRAGPGRMSGSALPGEPGNSVLSAHRDRHFRSLGALARGDTIVTETELGRTVWTVTRLEVVPAGAPALRAAATPTLTLTTCWPIRFFGPAPDRLIVTAHPVRASTAG